MIHDKMTDFEILEKYDIRQLAAAVFAKGENELPPTGSASELQRLATEMAELSDTDLGAGHVFARHRVERLCLRIVAENIHRVDNPD